jgi:hypothetical protein
MKASLKLSQVQPREGCGTVQRQVHCDAVSAPERNLLCAACGPEETHCIQTDEVNCSDDLATIPNARNPGMSRLMLKSAKRASLT